MNVSIAPTATDSSTAAATPAQTGVDPVTPAGLNQVQVDED